MWSYYGSKSKIVDCYPLPKYGKIIEPFAGSARYALKYWDRDVLLVDKYDVVVKIWKWLQRCSERDILSLKVPEKKIDKSDYDCEEAVWLMGFMVQNSVGVPGLSLGTLEGINPEANKKRIAKNLHKIRNWTIRQGCYTDLENESATWFIDPPYQFGGEYQYRHGSKKINFADLSEWCKSRNGQVIVCENTKADWMEFRPMKNLFGSNQTKTVEAIWSNLPTAFDHEQLSLF